MTIGLPDWRGKITISTGILFGLLFGLALACLAPTTALARTYKVATVAWAGWSPLQVAEQKQFWAKRGLHVKVVSYQDPIIILEALKAGRADFAMDMAGSMVGVHQDGEDVVILAETDWSNGGDKIVVKKGTRLSDHRGRPLGVFLNQPSCLFFLNKYLAFHNLSLADFRIVEIGAEALAAQFAAGRIPAMVLYEPWVGRALAGGGGRVLADSSEYPGCIPEVIWAYRGALTGVPEDHVVKLLAGWVEAAEWVNQKENWPEYARILNQYTYRGHLAYPLNRLSEMVGNVAIHDRAMLLKRNATNGGLAAYLRQMRDFLRENNMLQKEFKVGDLFDNRYIIKALHTTSPESAAR